MTHVEDRPEGLEEISAGLLTGAMVTLLGCALVGLVGWQIIAELTGWLPDLKAASAGLPPASLQTMTAARRSDAIHDSVLGGSLIFLTCGVIRLGAGLFRKNWALLRARRGERIANSSHL